jgi:hypothetical protein
MIMKWTYSFQHKLTASLLLFIVIGLVMFTNMRERTHSSQINEAISTIYNDRLMVESYIFQFAEHLHQVIDVLDNPELSEALKQGQAVEPVREMKILHQAYRETRLTPDEEIAFNDFTQLSHSIETHIKAGKFDEGKKASRKALSVLSQLSVIQVKEAKLQLTHAQKLFSSTDLNARFEMGVLIVAFLMVQALLFASRTLQINKVTQHSGLN